jgi:hypothetical protein
MIIGIELEDVVSMKILYIYLIFKPFRIFKNDKL